MPALLSRLLKEESSTVKRRLTIGAAAALVAVVLVGVGGYLYFFSNLRSSPPRLALSASPSVSSAPALTDLAGSWTVTTGSLARYRVKELFVGQTAKHDAVA